MSEQTLVAGVGGHPNEDVSSPNPKRLRRTLRFLKRGRELVLTVIIIAVVILLWQGIVSMFKVSSFVLPSPLSVYHVLLQDRSTFASDSWITTKEALFGLGLGIVIGVPLGLLAGAPGPLARTFYQIVVVVQLIPKVALAPLLVVWLGFGESPKIWMTFLLTFFPILLGAYSGVRDIPQEMVSLGKLCRLSWLKMMYKIKLPYATPHIFSGIKVAGSFCLVGAIVQEFVGASAGLGYLMIAASSNLNMPVMIGGVLIVTAIGFVLFGVIELAERLIIPWYFLNKRSLK